MKTQDTPHTLLSMDTTVKVDTDPTDKKPYVTFDTKGYDCVVWGPNGEETYIYLSQEEKDFYEHSVGQIEMQDFLYYHLQNGGDPKISFQDALKFAKDNLKAKIIAFPYSEYFKKTLQQMSGDDFEHFAEKNFHKFFPSRS